MRVRVEVDELYPYHFIVERGGLEVELTDEQLTLIRQAEDLWEEAQNLLSAAWDLAYKARLIGGERDDFAGGAVG